MLESIPGWIFIVGVVCLISTIAYTSQLFIILPALEWSYAESVKLLLPFNLLVLMVFYNYYLACATDPGRIPDGWEPPYSTFQSASDNEQDENDDDQDSAMLMQPRRYRPRFSEQSGMTGPRYCKSCKTYKPPRAHHCRYCRRCVLKMDHHCPWINNCVGHDNYGHFVRFVLFVDLATGYAMGLLVWRVRDIMDNIRHFRFRAEPSKTEVVFLVLNFVLAFVVLFCVGILSIYHLYCMSRNQSSIESYERSKVKTLIRRGKVFPVPYPYDIGFYKNICSVLGNNPLLWLWPQKAAGDGLTYPVRSKTDPRLPYCWPPRDPDDLRPSIFSKRYRRQQERRRQRQAARANPDAPRLIRRDSEGYLVREITLEDRMQMLQSAHEEDEDAAITTAATYAQQEQQEQQQQQHQQQQGYPSYEEYEQDDEVNSVEDYYDSGSYITDSEPEYDPRGDMEQGLMDEAGHSRWMEDRVLDLSGGDYYDYEDSTTQSWDDTDSYYNGDQDDAYRHGLVPSLENEDGHEDDDHVPLATFQQKTVSVDATTKAAKCD